MRKIHIIGLSCLTLLLCPNPAPASDAKFKLRFPVACTLDSDCWILAVPDTAAEKDKAQDHLCGSYSEDGLEGTRIAIRDEAAMKEGFDVIAAAPGKVLRLRDGETDQFADAAKADEIRKAKKDCGNGIIIDHGNDWLTQYCHLKQGSFKVKSGDEVRAGQSLAQIGLSGLTPHPQLQFTLRKKDQVINPFTANPVATGCGAAAGATSMWAGHIKLDAFNLFSAGFHGEKPDLSALKSGEVFSEPTTKSDRITFWIGYFAARSKDRIEVTLFNPNGALLVQQDFVQDQPQQIQHYAISKDFPAGQIFKGTYKGVVRVTRVLPNGETATGTLERELKIKD